MLCASLAQAAAPDIAPPEAPPAVEAGSAAEGTRYGPEFFEALRPKTALDMVLQLPGFTIDAGSVDRGLEGAGGNILVDGLRPGAKTGSIMSELHRIPASDVAEIRILRGAPPGIDMGGHAIVANVLRKGGNAWSGSASIAVDAGADGDLGTTATLEVGHRQQDASRSLGGSAGRRQERDDGERRLADAGGAILDAEDIATSIDSRNRSANLSLVMPVGSRLRLTVDGELGGSALRSEDMRRRRSDGTSILFASASNQQQARASLGANFEASPFLDFTGTLYRSQSRSLLEASSRIEGAGSRFASDEQSSETAARLVAMLALDDGAKLEVGADYAFNNFKSSASLLGPQGPIAIPNGEVAVAERRYGAFASYGWREDALDARLRLRVDAASLIAGGALRDRRRLVELKPSIQLGYQASDATRLDLTLERDVEQLAFSHFAAAAKLDDGTVKAGSSRIDPVRSWIAQASFQHGFWSSGSLTLTARAEAIANPIGFVPTAEALDASGNLDSAWRAKVEAKLALPLGPVGLSGVKLDLDQQLVRSGVEDPVTGDARDLADQSRWRWSAGLRHDLTSLPLSWGISLSGQSGTRQFRLREVSRSKLRPILSLFAEWSLGSKLSLRASASSGGGSHLTRRIHAGPRDRSAIAMIEESERRRARHFGLTLTVNR